MKYTAIRFLFSLVTIGLFWTTYGFGQLQIDINGPAGSGLFGRQVLALPGGNIVVTDPSYSIPSGATNVGAVYLHNGATGALISTLTGTTANDQVGGGGITALTNGNYVIRSFFWDGTAADVGAVTFGNGTTGVSGTVSAANSLVGSTASDFVGSPGLVALSNGNYVVVSTNWDGTAANVGAVTFGNGTTGTSGTVSAANSLVGSTAGDSIGGNGITALTNGNYVVSSLGWDGTATNVGAVTFGNGTTGISGTVSATNSLVGSTTIDQVGGGGITTLTNGNYVAVSPNWDGTATDLGAVTFGNGTTGISGAVSAANSLVGSTASDHVGRDGLVVLTNNNYLVRSGNWDGTAIDVGAVTFGNGTTGITGAVSAANSLVGSTANDNVGSSLFGSNQVTALTNGNYVVSSSRWDGAAADIGAVTFGDGTTGITGTVSAANSLVGSTVFDQVGILGATALTNGNYVVSSSRWDGAATDVGAVTFGNGTTGITGTVSTANSLVGSTASDLLGNAGITALTNGNYLVRSSAWDGTATNVGAVTFGSGTTGITGTVSAANSLVGSTTSDSVGSSGVTALTNGNYVVSSLVWDGTATNVGAATFGDGTTGITGTVSAANSLVGSTAFDQVSEDGVVALTNGNYVVVSSKWDGTATDVGAVTFGDGLSGISGTVSAINSLVGSTASDQVGFFGGVEVLPNGTFLVKSNLYDNGAIVNAGAFTFTAGNPAGFASIPAKSFNRKSKTQLPHVNGFAINPINSVVGTAATGGFTMNSSYDQTNNQVAVGRPADNIVTLARLAPTAANVSIGGRVQTVSGRGIPRAVVSIRATNGDVRTARTNQFGYYRFRDIEAGNTYIFNVSSKRYSFETQVINVSESITDLNFVASQ